MTADVTGIQYRALRAVLPLAAVAIEFCWLYPWILLLTGAFYGPGPTPLLPPWPAFGLLALGFVTVRLALARPWSLRRARIAVVTAGVASGLAAVKLTYYPYYAAADLRWILVLLRAAHDALPVVVPAVMGALTATLLWWRGVVLGERGFTHFEIEHAFRRGVAWTVVFILFYVIYGDARGFAATQPAPPYLLGFFSLSLLMLAVTRLLAIWQESQADDAQALAANRHWLLLLLAVVGVILSGAVAASGMLHVQFRPVLVQWLRPLEPLLEAVFLVLFAVAVVVAKAIIFVLSHLPYRPRALEPPPALQQPLSALLRQFPPHMVSGARWGVVLLVIALLTLLVAVAIVRARQKPRKVDEDERESVWSAQSMLTGMGQAWRSLWARLHRTPPAPEIPAVATLRAVYRELLRVGREIGTPRRPSETPYEYRPRLSDRLPEAASDIWALTEAYVRVRYSPDHPSPDQVDQAQAALERIRETLSPSQRR